MRRYFSTSAAHQKLKRIVVFGGSGFVGQNIIQCALANGINVTSINRKGKPSHFKESFSQGNVDWVKGDILKTDDWVPHLDDCDGAISCVGAFGTNQFMEKINGDANISAIERCKEAGVPRFVYISTLDNHIPELLPGYFNGKLRAEEALLRLYPLELPQNGDQSSSYDDATTSPSYSPSIEEKEDNQRVQEGHREEHAGNFTGGVILRPGFMHGKRTLSVPLPTLPLIGKPRGVIDIPLPLDLIGKPMEYILSSGLIDSLRSASPEILKILLAQPLPVSTVANVCVQAAVGDLLFDEVYSRRQVLSIKDIQALKK